MDTAADATTATDTTIEAMGVATTTRHATATGAGMTATAVVTATAEEIAVATAEATTDLLAAHHLSVAPEVQPTATQQELLRHAPTRIVAAMTERIHAGMVLGIAN